MADRFEEFGYKISKLSGKNKTITEDIVISTYQTYRSLDLISLADKFDIIIADEIHKGSGRNCSYEKILSTCLAPIRIGLTATIPKDEEKRMLIKGLFGDMIAEFTVEEGQKRGVLAIPKIKLIPIPQKKGFSRINSYRQAYQEEIVDNPLRNGIISQEIEKIIKNNDTVLVFCDKLDHIQNISKILDKKNIIHKIVEGKIDGDDRIIIKDKLANRSLKCVISSTVWTEGVTLPSLNYIINAGAGKSQERLIQKMGRGMGITEDKKTVVFIDFLDSGKWLGDHTVNRITSYVNIGWL